MRHGKFKGVGGYCKNGISHCANNKRQFRFGIATGMPSAWTILGSFPLALHSSGKIIFGGEIQLTSETPFSEGPGKNEDADDEEDDEDRNDNSGYRSRRYVRCKFKVNR